ncbi:MAG: 30S ribosomal protein S1 [Spirochaetes bacterium]|nr:30S ribosomal protein S1 [Spirochaetota bacterium]
MDDIKMQDINLDETIIRKIEKGELVKGHVVQITNEGVYLDIGAKIEGRIPIGEFDYSPKIGDEIEVLVIKKNESAGEIELSKEQAAFIKAWENIETIHNDTGYISGTFIEKLSNGYTVDIGIEAFLPFSQIKKVDDFEELKDKTFMFKIIRLDKRKGRVILSRREYIKENTRMKKEDLFSRLSEGDIIEGVVKNIKDFGIFVDLGGIDGLVPKKELSWKRFASCEDIVSINQKVKAIVISIDKKTERIVLSHKSVIPNPWSHIEEHLQIGMMARGKVVDIKPYGAFVEIEEGIDGFISLENLTWARHTKKPEELLSIGDEVQVKILDIDKITKKIKLGLKQVFPNPWDKVNEKYNVGQKLNVRIKRITGSGAYVEIADDKNIEGFIELAEVSWTKKFNHGKQAFKKGESLTAVVVDIDKARNLVKMGLKELEVNPWHILQEKSQSRQPVDCIVQKVFSRGAVVLVENKMEGFIPLSHFSDRKVEHPEAFLKKGEKIKCLILEIDEKKKRAVLSLKEYRKIKSQEEISQYLKKEPTEKMSIGDMINLKTTDK